MHVSQKARTSKFNPGSFGIRSVHAFVLERFSGAFVSIFEYVLGGAISVSKPEKNHHGDDHIPIVGSVSWGLKLLLIVASEHGHPVTGSGVGWRNQNQNLGKAAVLAKLHPFPR